MRHTARVGASEGLESRVLLSGVELVSVADPNLIPDSAPGIIANQAVSDDDRYVVFTSSADNIVLGDNNGLEDVFVRDTVDGTTTLVSVNQTGSGSGNSTSNNAVISGDGTRIAYQSRASDLVSNDTNGSRQDVFVRDLVAGATTLVSVNGSGTGSGNNQSFRPMISADGSTIAFESGASDLVESDFNTRTDVFAFTAQNSAPSIVADNAAVSVDEGDTAANSGTYNDPDGDPVTLSASVGTVINNGDGTWSWSYDATDDLPTTTVTITATDDDGESNSVSFDLTVENVNPTASPDSGDVSEDGSAITIDALNNDSDPAGINDPRVITGIDTTGTLGLVTFTAGEVSYDPNGQFESLDADDSTTDTFAYAISDGDGGVASGVVTITINGQNDQPFLVNPLADVEVNEGDPGTVIDVSSAFADIDADDTLTLSVSGNSNTSPVTTSIVGGNLVLDYQADQSGTAVITIRATDSGGLFVEDTLTVTVLSAADQLNNTLAVIEDLGLSGGNANALTSKLENAIAQLDAENTTSGVNKTHAFINQVSAFVNSGKLTEAEASVLIDAANAAISSTGPGGAALVMDGTTTAGTPASSQPVSHVGDLVIDTLYVSLVDTYDGVSADEQAALQSAINSLNGSLSAYGVALVEVFNPADSDFRVEIAEDSAGGSAADGLLGYAVAGEVTILSGWNWYTGADASAIGANQYDFQTVLTHELGHLVGLAHSGDVNSVMHETLATDVTRRSLTEQDLSLIDDHEEVPVALRAAEGNASDPLTPPEQTFAFAPQIQFSHPIDGDHSDTGKLNFGEAAADVGTSQWAASGHPTEGRAAVNQEMAALHLALHGDGEQDILIGFTGIDRFFANLRGKGPLDNVTDLEDCLFSSDLVSTVVN